MKKKTELLIWMLAVLPLVMALAAFPFLPDEVPMHWNLQGEVDRYGTRLEFFLLPSLALGCSFLLKYSPKIDPKGANYEKFKGAFFSFRLIMALFFVATTGITLYSTFVPQRINMNMVVTIACGVLFCTLGNYMPKIKHNYMFGIRTPWTLANEAVWHATHRMAGPIWFCCGLAMIVAAFVLSSGVLPVAILVLTLVCAFVPTVYSFLLFQKTKK